MGGGRQRRRVAGLRLGARRHAAPLLVECHAAEEGGRGAGGEGGGRGGSLLHEGELGSAALQLGSAALQLGCGDRDLFLLPRDLPAQVGLLGDLPAELGLLDLFRVR